MHPALRKLPLFYGNTPIFHFFNQKNTPISFPTGLLVLTFSFTSRCPVMPCFAERGTPKCLGP